MFLRVVEFKFFFTCIKNKKENRFIKLIIEIVKFVFVCFNLRVNGIIFFGVGDFVEKEYMYGEIVGCKIIEVDDDIRDVYID